jgi:PhzF family phenazine biosynthesis protein
MGIKLFQVDAFTDTLFFGNPAAVCILKDWLDEKIMQDIASENNLSETAFVVRKDDRYQIRWFTPNVEVDLCGHATLASAYVLDKYFKPQTSTIIFETTHSGILKVTKEDDFYLLDFPVDSIQKIDPPKKLLTGLRTSPFETYQGQDDYLVIYRSQKEIDDIEPDFQILAKLDTRGIIVTGPGVDVDFVSRFFAPGMGVNEDPVTGSAHRTLVPYWANKLHKKKLSAMQLSRRKGMLKCQLCDNRVKIAGKAKIYLIGEIILEQVFESRKESI